MTKLVNDVSHKGEAVNDENALLHTALPAGFEVEEINNTHTQKKEIVAVGKFVKISCGLFEEWQMTKINFLSAAFKEENDWWWNLNFKNHSNDWEF